MRSENEKMLAGELYDPFDEELVRARERARDLCQDLNASRERDQDCRRRILMNLVLEVWPVRVKRPENHEGNGHAADGEFLYEFASFDFLQLVKQVPVTNFHFSQQDAVFEIGWPEFGHELELRVHVEPAVGDDN